MNEIKDWSTAAVLSISTGVLFCEPFSRMHECAEWLMGHPIWTHHFANNTLCAEMRAEIAKQCPGLPLKADGINASNYLVFLSKVENEFGKTIKLRKGNGLTAMLPEDGLEGKPIVKIYLDKIGG